jgi:hypothetical protein
VSSGSHALPPANGSACLGGSDGSLKWRVHTPNLLAEIGNNNAALSAAMRTPLMILMRLLHDVGKEAARINDPELNALMCRLTIYSCADPESPDYDPILTSRVLHPNAEVRDAADRKL